MHGVDRVPKQVLHDVPKFPFKTQKGPANTLSRLRGDPDPIACKACNERPAPAEIMAKTSGKSGKLLEQKPGEPWLSFSVISQIVSLICSF
jgi:hypothetical protein